MLFSRYVLEAAVPVTDAPGAVGSAVGVDIDVASGVDSVDTFWAESVNVSAAAVVVTNVLDVAVPIEV